MFDLCPFFFLFHQIVSTVIISLITRPGHSLNDAIIACLFELSCWKAYGSLSGTLRDFVRSFAVTQGSHCQQLAGIGQAHLSHLRVCPALLCMYFPFLICFVPNSSPVILAKGLGIGLAEILS